jgi:hypothetical protein
LRQPKGTFYEYRYGYSDPCQQIIYANINLLKLYFKELGGIEEARKFLVYLQKEEDAPIHQVNSLSIALEVYDWWKDELPKKHKQHDDLLEEAMALRKTDRKLSDEKLRESLDDEINEKLKKIIDIRMSLWT